LEPVRRSKKEEGRALKVVLTATRWHILILGYSTEKMY